MIYVCLFIIATSAFTLCIKWTYATRNTNVVHVGAINYIAAALCFAPTVLVGSPQFQDSSAWLLGGAMGVIYFVNFFFVIYCVRIVGASTTTVVGVLSMLIPILFAAWIWGAIPNWIQMFGISLAIISLLLIGLRPNLAWLLPLVNFWRTPVVQPRNDQNLERSPIQDERLRRNELRNAVVHTIPSDMPFAGDSAATNLSEVGSSDEESSLQIANSSREGIPIASTKTPVDSESNRGLLITVCLTLFFLLCGASRVTQEAFKYQCLADQKPSFVFAAFVASGLPSLAIILTRLKNFSWVEFGIGFFMGIANGGQTWLALKSLESMPGYLFFPISSAGAIVFTLVMATVIFRERTTKIAMIGIVLAVIALVLMNVRYPF